MTEIFKNPALCAMRALALSAFDKVEWRHHGIGVLQGYVREHSEPEIRLHVWSRRLLKLGMDLSGDIHDHRFDMVSHVLYGFVEHEEVAEREDPEGGYAMMALTHARAAADTNYHGPTTPLPGRFKVTMAKHVIDEGYSYSFKAQRFHHSPLVGGPDDVAVTCVEKHRQQDAPARLLYPVKHEPVMAFGHTPDRSTILSVLAIARDGLSG